MDSKSGPREIERRSDLSKVASKLEIMHDFKKTTMSFSGDSTAYRYYCYIL